MLIYDSDLKSVFWGLLGKGQCTIENPVKGIGSQGYSWQGPERSFELNYLFLAVYFINITQDLYNELLILLNLKFIFLIII